MNKLILILLIGLSLTSFRFSEYNSEFNIIGKWEAKDQIGIGQLVFDANGYAKIKFGTKVLGGKKFIRDGKEFSLEYKIIYDKSPITLDLIFTEIANEKKLVWPCIIDVIDDNKIFFARGKDGNRPENFTDYDYIMLERVK